MKTFKHLLVPTDFSDTAREALRTARDLARDTASRLSVIHVVDDVMCEPWVAEEAGADFAAVQQEWLECARKLLSTFVSDEGLTQASVTTAVLVGKPHVAIVEYADEQTADLIVMGTHGHGVIRRFLLGSVTERVVRTAHCPVLTVPLNRLRVREEVHEFQAAALETVTHAAEHAVNAAGR